MSPDRARSPRRAASGARLRLAVEAFVPLLALAYTAYYLYSTRTLAQEGKAYVVYLSVGIVALAGWRLLKLALAARGQGSAGRAAAVDEAEADAEAPPLRAVTAVMAMSAAYVAVVATLGFILATALLGTGSVLAYRAAQGAGEDRGWWRAGRRAVVLGVVTSIATFAALQLFFRMELPAGPLESAIERLVD